MTLAWARAAVAGLALLAVAACSPRTAEQAPPLPSVPHPAAAGPAVAAVRRAGRLRVAADLSVPPMAFRDSSGPRGFDVDLVGLVAQALGVRAEITDTPIGVLRDKFPADADLAVGGLPTGTVPGAASAPYAVASPTIVWGSRTRGHDLAALRGRPTAAPAGSAGERIARDAGVTLVSTYLPEQSLAAVASGRVDAAITDGPEGLGFVAGRTGLRATSTGVPATPLVLVVRPGAEDLADYVSAVIQALRAGGGLDQLRRRWSL
ncbi:MAG TPA: transporter substrate-binding domain-containing protein [bacterium]|nr:transporter substrate-binding domain-containing protein [bacterium]